MDTQLRNEEQKAERDYPGAAIDKADGDRVTEKEVKERVKVENNNPRNND